MKIRRTSWHFRVYRLLISMWTEGPFIFEGARSNHRPKNLCHYFWTVVLMILLLPIWLVVGVVVGIVLGLAYGIYLLWDSFAAERRIKRAARAVRLGKLQDVPKQLNLMREFLKARKAKVCPLIKVVDE
jgi:hypothetical protein